MNRSKWILAIVTLLLIGGAAGVLAKYKSIQKLGNPGVKTEPIAGTKNVKVVLPETVLDYTSELIDQSEVVTNVLPKDTCYGQRRYTGSDKSSTQVNVVLMGADRSSLHKPQYCLTGAGWTITKTEIDTIPMTKPFPYELQVIKLTASSKLHHEGQTFDAEALYVYWYVTDGSLSANPTGSDRMWSIARSLLTTGVLQRWAYISCFAPSVPGKEDEAYRRVREWIAAAVPKFQLATAPRTELARNP